MARSLQRAMRSPKSLRIELWNGSRFNMGGVDPAVTLRINKPAALRFLVWPTLSRLGKAYVEGYVDVEGPLDEVIATGEALSRSVVQMPSISLRHHNKRRDADAIAYHYDVSNEFYALWLDRNRVYSCAYFNRDDDDLDRAQEQKLEHICRKLRLRPGERFLDIGCGWGALLFWAVRHYGVQATGITLSRNQYEYVTERIAAEGLEGQMEVRLQDYRELVGERRFDKIASVGMFEHVGPKRLPGYFELAYRLLRPGGLMLNHGIVSSESAEKRKHGGGAFIAHYVFPEAELPRLSALVRDAGAEGLETLDIECLRPHYAQTLRHWSARLEACGPQAQALIGSQRYRIWLIYTAACALAFERGWVSVYQMLLSRANERGQAEVPWTRGYMYGGEGA